MDRFIREIAITEIDGVSIGHAQDNEAKTGAIIILNMADILNISNNAVGSAFYIF